MRILKQPKVYLVGRTTLVSEGFNSFLQDSGLRWPTPVNGIKDAEVISELAGRCCYMSFGGKAGSKTNFDYISNILGRMKDGTFRDGPAHGAVMEHPCFTFIVVGAGRGWCYDDQTEVLTEEGWKFWNEIRGDEFFATLNLRNDELEYQKATAITREEYEGNMYKLKSRMVDMVVTPNHRMLYRKPDNDMWETAPASFLQLKRFKCKRNVGKWNGKTPTSISVGENTAFRSEIFAEFLGWWLAEGHLDHTPGSGYSVVLSQNCDTEKFDSIIEVVKKLGLPYTINGKQRCKAIKIASRELYEYLKPYNLSENKRIPQEIKSWGVKELRLLIQAHLQGDGGFTARGSGEAYTVSKQLANDLQELALKCGWSATLRVVDRREESERNDCRIKHMQICYVVSYCKVRNEPLVNHNGKRHDSLIKYKGEIFCATVPNGYLYVRRNGRPIWSGNSHEQVRHRVGWAYSQLSTRYCDYEQEETDEGDWEPAFVIPPLGQLSTEAEEAFIAAFKRSQEEYVKILNIVRADLESNSKFMSTLEQFPERERKKLLTKAARGAARDVLVNGTEAIMVMSANARSLWNTIYLRANEQAEAVIRDVYYQISKIMEQEMPSLFHGLIYDTCWDGTNSVTLPREKL